MGTENKKVYCRDVYGEKIPLIDKNTGLQKVDKQNRKQWKCYKDDYTDWNKREKVEEWRSRWAEHCNMALEKAQSIARVDHRSYAAQGIEELPTIHEGYIARKIEANGGISERCEINREIRGHNWLIRKCLYEIQLLTKQITDLMNQKGEEINERFANLFKRQNRSREDSKTERADPNRKRGVEGSELRSFIANLDSQRQTAEFDRQRSETERKIAKMSESDKIELENKRLKEKNESLKREKYQAEQEAKMRVRNFKAQYDADYREMNEQKERLANRKKNWMRKKPTSRKVYLMKLDTFAMNWKKIPIQTQLTVCILCWNNAL